MTAVSGWASWGCYDDSVGTWALMVEIYSILARSMTVELCVENYGRPTTSGCNISCNGNAGEICGGSNRLNVYTYIGWSSRGCYNDTVGTRSLNTEIYSISRLRHGLRLTKGIQMGGCPWGGYSIFYYLLGKVGSPKNV